MEPQTFRPSDRTQSKRCHSDPPALWLAVILGSFAIHLCLFGILRLLLTASSFGLHSNKKLIPVDVVALVPTTRPTTQLSSKTATSTLSARQNNTNQGKTKLPPASNIRTPITNSNLPKKNSAELQPKPQPNSPRKNAPSSTAASPTISPSSTSSSSTVVSLTNSPSSTSSSSNAAPNNSQSEGSFIAYPGQLTLIPSGIEILHPGDPNYNDELATLLDSSKRLSKEDLTQLGISLEQDLELKVNVLIDTDGTAKVISAQVVRGSLSTDKAMAIANKIIPQWRFKPTTMSRKDSPVRGNYDLPLTIRPAPK